jgi:hypothetical protein
MMALKSAAQNGAKTRPVINLPCKNSGCWVGPDRVRLAVLIHSRCIGDVLEQQTGHTSILETYN